MWYDAKPKFPGPYQFNGGSVSGGMWSRNEVVRVESFADSAVTIRARMKTKLAEQWKIGREYRRRLKKAFDAEGIEIPFPSRTLFMGEASPPLKVEVIAGLELTKG